MFVRSSDLIVSIVTEENFIVQTASDPSIDKNNITSVKLELKTRLLPSAKLSPSNI